jgi:hypothetical protein
MIIFNNLKGVFFFFFFFGTGSGSLCTEEGRKEGRKGKMRRDVSGGDCWRFYGGHG